MYPITLEIKGRRVLVVGGGGVSLRKVQGLVEEGARVVVISPEVVEPLETMASTGEIELERRPYAGEAAGEWALVFAATDDRETNARVFRDAEDAGLWCNVADDPEYCSFHLPGRVRRGPLQLALASAGEAPFATARLRRLFESRIGEEWTEWMDSASRYRTAVRRLEISHSEANELFDRFFEATVDADRLTARVPTETEEREWLRAPVDHRSAQAPILQPPSSERGDSDSGAGFVALVGAGPGCPGLMTVRGRRRLMNADAVVYDRLAAPALPCDLPAEVELHAVGKVAGNHPTPQEEINALLVRLAREGKKVVRLKGGDPYVFGRGGEEAEVLQSEGVPFEVVSGVTSGVAALAWAGIPATHRKESVRLTLLTAHEAIKSDGPQIRWDLLARDRHATIVGYMGVTALPQVIECLLAAGMDPTTPAAMVEQGTTAAQRRVISTVEHLEDDMVRAGLEPPALFAIGPTIRHADRLGWFDALPLKGLRIVMTSVSSKLASYLEDRGAETVVLPTPVTPAARIVMAALPISGCVVGARAEVDWIHEELGSSGWQTDSIAWCIGSETAERARDRGWRNVVALDEGLDPHELAGRIAATRSAQ